MRRGENTSTMKRDRTQRAVGHENVNRRFRRDFKAVSRKLPDLLASGAVTQAREEVARMAERYPDQALVDIAVADFHLAAGEVDDGVKALRRALEREPDNWRVRARIARILTTLERYDDALELLKATEKWP